MVKRLSCLPSKQAAGVRLPFGVSISNMFIFIFEIEIELCHISDTQRSPIGKARMFASARGFFFGAKRTSNSDFTRNVLHMKFPTSFWVPNFEGPDFMFWLLVMSKHQIELCGLRGNTKEEATDLLVWRF
jgi:hypothetical protein